MQFGCCLSGRSFAPEIVESSGEMDALQGLKDEMESLVRAGYHFAELTVGTVALASEEEFAQIQAYLATAKLSVPVLNSFIPPHLKLTGPDVDEEQIAAYVDLAMSRVKAIGAMTIIFGSGAARSYPQGFAEATAREQLDAFLQLVSELAVKHELTVAIEPLNQKESNIIHTVREALEICERLQLPRIAVLADSFHMLLEQEDASIVKEVSAAGKLAHVHFADRDRRFPGVLTVADGGADFAYFLQQLAEAGYEGLISMECRMDRFAPDGEQALPYLQQFV